MGPWGYPSGHPSGVLACPWASLGGPPVVMFLIAKGSNAAQTRVALQVDVELG